MKEINERLKEALGNLYQIRVIEFFSLDYDVDLYDLANSYCEGAKREVRKILQEDYGFSEERAQKTVDEYSDYVLMPSKYDRKAFVNGFIIEEFEEKEDETTV